MPGVGKLTVARELARLTVFRLFHNHLTVDLLTSVFEFGSDAFVELREKIWLDVFRYASRAQLDGLIFTFAYDHTVRPEFIAETKEIVEAGGGEVLFVELRCSSEELERRVAAPSRSSHGKLNSLAQFHDLKNAGAFIDPGIPRERIRVETTELTPLDAALRIVRDLGLE